MYWREFGEHNRDNMVVHYKHDFIESMRAHVITIYGKRTGKP